MAKSIADRLKVHGVDASRGTITYIDPTALTVITDKAHPLYDPRAEEPLDEGLVIDIMERGVLQPILCRDNGSGPNGPILQVVAGRRRTLHLIEANKRRPVEQRGKMPVVFVHGDDKDMLLIAIAENAQRKTESFTSLAWKVRSVIKLGHTEADVAKAIGSSPKRVRSLLMFLNLSTSVQRSIESGKLPIGSIDVIADVPREEQDSVLERLQEAGATKNHEVVDAVTAIRNGETYHAPTRKKTWGRAELKVLRETLELTKSTAKEVRVAIAMIDLVTGNEKTVKEWDWVAAALSDAKRTIAQKARKAAKRRERREEQEEQEQTAQPYEPTLVPSPAGPPAERTNGASLFDAIEGSPDHGAYPANGLTDAKHDD